jgi:putative transposase
MMSVAARRALVERDNKILSISNQCKILGLSRSSYYYTHCTESDENLSILRWLDAQYLDTPFYGARKLLMLLRNQGIQLNIKKLRRLMSIHGWQTIYPIPRTTVIDPDKYKYPYLLKDLKTTSSNHVWAIDITYCPMSKGFMYLVSIIDLHSRYVVGWDINNSMSAEWIVDVIIESFERYGVPLILNSDQGSQFTSVLYVSLLKNRGIEISMDGKGRAIDNIFIERLWRSVKYEHLYLFSHEDGNALYAGLKKYFEFYNHVRLHQSLNYETPASWYFQQAA